MTRTDQTSTAAALRAFMAQRFLLDAQFGDDADLFEQGIVDSFGLIDLIAHLEATFSISLSKADLASGKLATLRGICELVDSKRA